MKKNFTLFQSKWHFGKYFFINLLIKLKSSHFEVILPFLNFEKKKNLDFDSIFISEQKIDQAIRNWWGNANNIDHLYVINFVFPKILKNFIHQQLAAISK